VSLGGFGEALEAAVFVPGVAEIAGQAEQRESARGGNQRAAAPYGRAVLRRTGRRLAPLHRLLPLAAQTLLPPVLGVVGIVTRGREQRAERSDGLRPLAGRRAHRKLHRVDQLGRIGLARGGEERLQRIRLMLERGVRALRRRGRLHAGHAAVKRAAERVDVAPRPLRRAALVLLVGGVALRDDGAQSLALAAHGLARRAEIEQQRRAVLAQEDVVGLDVAMEEALGVHRLERIEQRIEDAAQLGLAEVQRAPQARAERGAALVFHDQIAGAVGLEILQHGDDVLVLQRDQRARLEPEALEPPGEIEAAAAQRPDRDAVGRALRHRRGEKLLDRDQPIGELLGRAIGDAEAARPQHGAERIDVELRALRQRVGPAIRHGHGSPTFPGADASPAGALPQRVGGESRRYVPNAFLSAAAASSTAMRAALE
jgi:hypothetical protein